MPRPKKERRLCINPSAYYFKPRGIPIYRLEESILDPDELESIRLADYEKLSHKGGAASMKISRATFGRILGKAQFKIAGAILNGKAIQINSLE